MTTPNTPRKPRPLRDVDAVLRELEKNASDSFRADMAARYGIVTQARVLGTPMASIKHIAKPLGRDHAFAEELWETGVYEARMLASMVDEPERVTAAQMDRWLRDCDNWALVDTLCFKLFDRTPHAFAKVAAWSRSDDEFVKRGGFALLACLALHGRGDDADFAELMPCIEREATDSRNFVKKGLVSQGHLGRGPQGTNASWQRFRDDLSTCRLPRLRRLRSGGCVPTCAVI